MSWVFYWLCRWLLVVLVLLSIDFQHYRGCQCQQGSQEGEETGNERNLYGGTEAAKGHVVGPW